MGKGISVTGQGRASATPDVMRVNLVATALRPSVAEALAASERAVTAMRAALAARGVRPDDAHTVGLMLNPEQVWAEQTGPRTVGYRSEHRLAVTLRDLAGAGVALGEVVAAGGDDVRLEGISFEVDDDSALRETARERAWASAEAMARQLAGLAGRELGPVLEILEQGGYSPGPIPMMAMASAGKREATDVGVQPGSVAVETSLAVRWSLHPAESR